MRSVLQNSQKRILEMLHLIKQDLLLVNKIKIHSLYDKFINKIYINNYKYSRTKLQLNRDDDLPDAETSPPIDSAIMMITYLRN